MAYTLKQYKEYIAWGNRDDQWVEKKMTLFVSHPTTVKDLSLWTPTIFIHSLHMALYSVLHYK